MRVFRNFKIGTKILGLIVILILLMMAIVKIPWIRQRRRRKQNDMCL
jgi:putative effector of murein hydrolase LrgA (UPF0299 family)